jgi:rod shape-determining protein MreB
MDDAVITHLKRAHNLLIGERTAEQIKVRLGSATPLPQPLTMEVKGRHVIEGMPKTVTVSDGEVREALADAVAVVVRAVMDGLEHIPPELSSDIYDRGIVLTGGGALLQGLDERLRLETGLPVCIAEDPLSTVVLGAGKMLSDFALLRKISMD